MNNVPQQNQIQSLKDLTYYYNNTDSRYIYFDKTFDVKGIDYTKFIQLKYESINNNHIKDIYTIDGWYILWYLMSRSTKSEYIATTVNSISEETNLKQIKIKETLDILSQQEVIICNKNLSKITNTELLYIYIGYNNNLCSHITQKGYIPIPTEFVYRIIPTLTSIEWAIYTVLLTKYNYYLAWETINKDTGELIPVYYRTHYAFPSRTQIGNIIGAIDDTVSKFIKKLENNKYNLIYKYKSDPYSFWDKEEQKQKLRGGNNRYEIKLFERPEYIYYYLNPIFDKETQDKFNYIKKNKFDKIALSHEQNKIVNNKVFYIRYYYEDILLQYDKCIKERDGELYKHIREDDKIKI